MKKFSLIVSKIKINKNNPFILFFDEGDGDFCVETFKNEQKLNEYIFDLLIKNMGDRQVITSKDYWELYNYEILFNNDYLELYKYEIIR